MTLTHLFPGITPWNVWDLPYWLWVQYAEVVDQRVTEQQRRRANGGRDG